MRLHPSAEHIGAAITRAPAHPTAALLPGSSVEPTNNSVTVSVAVALGFAALLVLLLLLLLVLLLRRRSGGSGATPSTQEQAPLVHFIPDEVTLVVEHAPGLPAAQILQGVARDPRIAAAGDLSQALVRSGRVTTLSRSVAQAISLVVATVQGLDQAGLLKLINGLQSQVGRGQDGSAGGAAGVTIVGASPNWLTSGCPVSGGTGGGGGPGGTPVAPAVAPTSTAWRLNLPAALAAAGNEGDGIHVAIMDTAPCETDLAHAYARWGTASLEHPAAPHELIASLLRPEGPLRVYHAGGAHLLQTVDYRLDAHHYPMPDHGLFVAGIVHSLVPQARIHLIEALNPYGVGTLETFAQAFRVVQLLAEGRDPSRIGDDGAGDVDTLAETAVGSVPVVLNCSFMFSVAADASPSNPDLQHDADLSAAMGAFPNVWEALIGREHVPIVAAAGNDRTVEQTSTNTFPLERYPAAFDGVIGVGALDSTGAPTMYTDLAHRPAVSGIAVFGGDVSPASGPDAPSPYIANPNSGMLGIFVGTKFPDGTPNTGGWARWAGTSFSAPVITGLVARTLATLPGATGLTDPTAIHDALLAPLLAVATAATPVGNSLLITQG